METITSKNNSLIKSARALRDRKERQKSGKFLVEGILPVGEASSAGWQIDFLLYSKELLASDFAGALIKQESFKGTRCVLVSADVLESVAEKDNPQGILAVVSQKKYPLSAFSQSGMKRGVALVAPQDPGNVGTILRTMDAVGADGLFLLDGGVDPFHPSSVRASMGTLFWKPVVTATFTDFRAWAAEMGYRLIGTTAHAKLDFREIILDSRSTILVLGNEQKGLSKEQMATCEVNISLPMRGKASSLNLAVAAGILMYHLFS
jgi:RNA methyltransferase, TrmH family